MSGPSQGCPVTDHLALAGMHFAFDKGQMLYLWVTLLSLRDLIVWHTFSSCR